MKDFARSVAAAVERAIQLNEWLDHLEDTQNSMSPYAPAIKNRVKNTKVQLSQKTAVQAALQLAQAAGAAAACSGISACGRGAATEKAAFAAEKGIDLIYKIKTKAEMDAQWRLFKEAFANPDNRRKGKKALAGNPTLSKYAIAYGAARRQRQERAQGPEPVRPSPTTSWPTRRPTPTRS